MPLHVKAAFFSDDVRYEQGNKISAMGIYNDGLRVPAGDTPFGLPKVVAIFIVGGLKGERQLEFRQWLSFEPGPPWPKPALTGLARDPNSDENNFVNQFTPAVFPGPGTLTAALEIRLGDGKSKTYTTALKITRESRSNSPAPIEVPN